MYVTVLVILLAGQAFCQYVNHPFGAFSYVTGYKYVAPSGQTVNVKYATSASVEPPQHSVLPQLSAAPFVFHSSEQTPTPLALSLNGDQHYAPQTQSLTSFPAIAPGAPSPGQLFRPGYGAFPVESEKQRQASNDDLITIAQEAASGVPISSDFDPEVKSYVSVKLGGY